MQNDVSNLRSTIIPKSDQLNADQLLGNDMIITVTGVSLAGSPDQPVSIHYENEAGRPFKPCKTVRKILIALWGEDGNAWIGRTMHLFCDEKVKWAGEAVGGIRVKAMSHIECNKDISLTETRGKKVKARILKLTPENNAANTQPSFDKAACLESLKAAALKGTDSLKSVFTALSTGAKHAVKDDMDALKLEAAKYDTPAQGDF
jgi:hypothetical protein